MQGGLNTYTYVENNPLLKMDLLGLKSCFNPEHCRAQANANLRTCLKGDRGYCAAVISSCFLLREPRLVAICIAIRAVGCSAPCVNHWKSDRSLCKWGLPIDGYRPQENYDDRGCGCISNPEYLGGLD